MNSESEEPIHPGEFIKDKVIPADLTVTKAAEILHVGRPALSNLLNGNSSLSLDMAVKLEKTFGANRQVLLEMQADFENHEQRAKERSITIGTYVPAFLAIKARQIHAWAEGNINARQLLAVLLRRLIHSTGRDFRTVDFPGYDNSERKGCDGVVETDATTPWIPEGRSCWEFGVDRDPRRKAERDYANRVASISSEERKDTTFVFVTPRNWPGKTAWAEEKQATGEWKAVRAYDASDLEQWLEQSISAQIWIAQILGIPAEGVETLNLFWNRWVEASDPRLTPTIFESLVTAYRGKFTDWLKEPPERSFVIAANSKDEAIAFLYCLFQDEHIPLAVNDLVAVFTSAQTLRSLTNSSSDFIPIAASEETERELPGVAQRFHSIIVRLRNYVSTPQPDIILDLLDHESFRKALVDMGIEKEQVDRLARESGRSVTILRRRLSKNVAVRTPIWVNDTDAARSLIPMALLGAWHSSSLADREIISVLSDCTYERVEREVVSLLRFDDCPVWSFKSYYGVSSKIDALFAVSSQVTKPDIIAFFWIAEYVLSERDPALDLPEEDRWAADVYDKVREHSAALRESICETLVILSVHGDFLFRERLGISVEAEVSRLIAKLLSPLTLEKLLSQKDDLPAYAEAGPDRFLTLIEDDLQSAQPVVFGLLKPTGSGIFSRCPRTGLVWALECLAWKHIGRVSKILAQLSRTLIEDNWTHKPINSLQAIYRFWCPQTIASLEDRMNCLEMLVRQYPDIGWQICLAQLAVGPKFGDFSHRPRWRSDASGADRPVMKCERLMFKEKAFQLAIAWPSHDQNTLGDLVANLDGMSEKEQDAVWDQIERWADTQADDMQKAELREQMRQFAFPKRHRRHRSDDTMKGRLLAIYNNLEPTDIVVQHAWLFASEWIEWPVNELEDEGIGLAKQHKAIRKYRKSAIDDIWTNRGFDGVKALLASGSVPELVGEFMAYIITDKSIHMDFVLQCLSVPSDGENRSDRCIYGFVSYISEDIWVEIVSNIAKITDLDGTVRLFKCLPFKSSTWRLLDSYNGIVSTRYWQEVNPFYRQYNEAEINEIVDRLIEAKRPHAAFFVARIYWDSIETSRLIRLLKALWTEEETQSNWYRPDAYEIAEALKSLDERGGVNTDQKAQLEFKFIDALRLSDRGIPNLERQIFESPIPVRPDIGICVPAFRRRG